MDDAPQIEASLAASQAALDSGKPFDLSELGFWRAVAAAKRDPSLRSTFGRRIAAIDRMAFERWALVKVPLRVGTWIMLTATTIALAVIGVAYAAADPWDGLLLVAGTVGLIVTTHGLGHLLVGAMSDIRFTHWFIGSVARPQPGVKIDYESYLAATAPQRARMHASGALVSKIVPFLMLGAAWGMDAQAWAWWILVLIGLGSIATDVLWSGKASDWKRYAREKRLADAGF